MDCVLDVDLKSCYGTALASLEYPIGIPSVVAFCPNEKKLRLKDFLNTYEGELLPGLYKITVSGKLSFEQDLLFSKVTTYDKMREPIIDYNKRFEEGDMDAVHFANDFVLSLMEFLNAVLTHDLLEVLKKVSTNRELKEIMSLQVETAIFWKKSNRCSTCTEWISKVLKNPGEFIFDENNQGVSDTSSRLWYPLSLNDFIGK